MNEYKFEIERLSRELQDVKRKYYEVKRRAALADTHPADVGAGGGVTLPGAGPGSVRLPPSATRIAAAQQIAAQEAKSRFTGGGFAVSGH